MQHITGVKTVSAEAKRLFIQSMESSQLFCLICISLKDVLSEME